MNTIRHCERSEAIHASPALKAIAPDRGTGTEVVTTDRKE